MLTNKKPWPALWISTLANVLSDNIKGKGLWTLLKTTTWGRSWSCSFIFGELVCCQSLYTVNRWETTQVFFLHLTLPQSQVFGVASKNDLWKVESPFVLPCPALIFWHLDYQWYAASHMMCVLVSSRSLFKLNLAFWLWLIWLFLFEFGNCSHFALLSGHRIWHGVSLLLHCSGNCSPALQHSWTWLLFCLWGRCCLCCLCCLCGRYSRFCLQRHSFVCAHLHSQWNDAILGIGNVTGSCVI